MKHLEHLLIGLISDIENEVHRIRSNPIRAALRKNLIGPLQAAKSRICIEPSFEKIDDEWLDPEKEVLRTPNRPFRAALRKDLIGPLQKLSSAATSGLCIKPFVKVIIDAMLDVKKGVLKTRNTRFRAGLYKSFFQIISFCMEPSVKIIIDAVLDVEEGVRRTWNSTFRATLYKYLNHFPQEFGSLLLDKIEEQEHGRFLAQILEHPESAPLRKVVVENVEILIENSGGMGVEKDTRYTAVINSIHIMHSLCKFEGDREWMDKKDIIIWFKMVYKTLEAHMRTNTLAPHLRLAAKQASEQLMVIFTKFLEHHPTDLDALFSLIDSVTNEDYPPTQPLLEYIYHHIICSNSIKHWKAIVMRSLDVYASKSTSQRTKTFLFHNLVNPIIAMDVKRISTQRNPKCSRLMDKAVIESIHTKIWKVGLGDPNDDLTQPGIDHTRMEVLQLTAMLVKYYHSILQDIGQDVIKFGLTYIRLEDIISKYAAYVVIGYCIALFETPAEIVQQVYISLLESSHNEGRALVTQALELIASVLPKLCNATPDDQNPFWVAAPCRILIDERQNAQQIATIFRFLVKHAGLFYEHRDKFIIIIVMSLRTIAQPPNPSNQSKELVLQLMTLVWQWEQ